MNEVSWDMLYLETLESVKNNRLTSQLNVKVSPIPQNDFPGSSSRHSSDDFFVHFHHLTRAITLRFTSLHQTTTSVQLTSNSKRLS